MRFIRFEVKIIRERLDSGRFLRPSTVMLRAQFVEEIFHPRKVTLLVPESVHQMSPWYTVHQLCYMLLDCV